MAFPSTANVIAGGQVLRMDSRLEVIDDNQAVSFRYPIADNAAIGDQGEFYFRITLNSLVKEFVFDETLTGFSGNSRAEDIDFLYIATTGPILVKFGWGIPVTALDRNLSASSGFDVKTFLVWKTGYPMEIVPEDGFDQRVLPFKIYLGYNGSGADVVVYMAKFGSLARVC